MVLPRSPHLGLHQWGVVPTLEPIPVARAVRCADWPDRGGAALVASANGGEGVLALSDPDPDSMTSGSWAHGACFLVF